MQACMQIITGPCGKGSCLREEKKSYTHLLVTRVSEARRHLRDDLLEKLTSQYHHAATIWAEE